MAKKKKKSKIKKRKSTKRKVKSRKKIPKKRKVTKKKSRIKRKSLKTKKNDTSSQELIFKTRPEWIKASLANKSQYQNKYNESIKNNNAFWKKEGKRITWIKPYKKIKDVKYSKDEVRIKWFEDGTLNASANCIDRHLKDKKDKTAIIWVGDDPKDTQKISYKQLHQKVSKAANGLKKLGDVWYHDLIKDVPAHCEPEEMSAEDPLFILYTSGSTGKPKGVLHTTGGYMVYASMTHQYIFNYKPKDIYWCTADIGWVTGHSYIIYGPLSNGATTIMFEGVPNYPDSSRWWQIVDKFKVNTFYTAPTAIRALMREGNEPVNKTSRKSLKLLGTVGEPINPEAWMWYYKTVGNSKCPIVDTWWQTETGGILISPQTGAIPLKPGSATKPFYGIKPVLVDKDGKEIKGAGEGRLCIAQSWPGQMRTVYGDHQRFIDTYFSQFDGKYFTGDGCRRDKDGYYWITGRVDDVIIVSGHNLGTAEIESAFVAHPKVAEAAVVGYPHDIKGNGLYCYVTLNAGESETGDLERELKLWVRKQIGPLATPDLIHFTPGLPKTRSGKIMRRILRKIAANEQDQLGDTTTLADPSVVTSLVDNRKNT